MPSVRVLVGTRKGAFIFQSDEGRKQWDIKGPLFAGWEIYHMKGSPLNPNRIYASQSGGWFGQVVQRSDDGGESWETVNNEFLYKEGPKEHKFYDGSSKPWKFVRVWHFEPSLHDPETVYAGAEDAALFVSRDGGNSWSELAALRNFGTGHEWFPGAGGLCLHTILQDPRSPDRLYIAISAVGAFRTDDAGQSWKIITKGLHSDYMPDPDAEGGHCVHNMALHPSRPDVLFMQKHWDVMRTDNAGDLWYEISNNLPTDFGFPIAVHAHEPDTVYVVPITSDALHYPPDGKLRVYRSRNGGQHWEALGNGLPQRDCYVNVLRDAMAVDQLESCGIYFGTTGGHVFVSPDGGDTWQAIAENLPSVLSVEVQTLP